MNKSLIILAAILCLVAGLAFARPPQMLLEVPYHRQETEYSCGAASLQMVLEYFLKVPVDQYAIMNVARTSPTFGTVSHDLARAAQFSAVSSAAAHTFPDSISVNGYQGRPIGFGSFFHSSPSMS